MAVRAEEVAGKGQGGMRNEVLIGVQAEKASGKGQGGTPNLYSRTLEKFYHESAEQRKALREGTFKPGKLSEKREFKCLKMSRSTSGVNSSAAISTKAMKHSNGKEKNMSSIDEKKEENFTEATVKQRDYPHSLSEKYVQFLDGEMAVVDRGISLKGLRTILQEYMKNEASFENFLTNNSEVGQYVKMPGETLTHMLVKPETRKNDCYIELLYGVFKRMVTCAKDEEIVSIEEEL